MPYMPDVRDAQQTPLFDTYQLAANQSTPRTIIFFAEPESPTKGPWLTNLKRAYQIDNNQKFTCFGMGFMPIDMHETDILNFYKNYVARLIVGQKAYLEAPLEHFPGGGGISGTAATTATSTTIRQWSNGIPSPQAVQALAPDYAIEIAGGDTFRVELVGNSFTSTAAIFLRCYLFGVYEKGVQ
ncbi:MAG: hypothetical protein NZ765_09650 [Anaerolineae bacterium]|nr:hypothetical protein [Anaerolineae bacterium]MDW8071877.1 hypothetical protein [Anaerolineae bacterium]